MKLVGEAYGGGAHHHADHVHRRCGHTARIEGGRIRLPAQEHASQGVARRDSQGPFREEDRSARSSRAARGEALSEREIGVLRQIAGGTRNKDIADRLFISEETVKVHVKHIMEKLGASDRTQAMAIAVRRGIIEI